ncbi:MAG: NUDIX hydrolase [Deltaproteobacteria bacterium]|nr:NUDIX hydrolase [Deltaproteobacteria bacterium]
MTWRNPTPTVDIILERDGQVLLIERRNPPHGWALPGGFVDEGETVEQAARREAMEETRLEVQLTALLHVYSDPARDPRKHTLSVVFVGTFEGEPAAGDDAGALGFFPLDDLPQLAFDHATILADYLRFRDTGARPL